MGKPSKGIGRIEEAKSDLPLPSKWIDKEDIPGEGNEGIIHYIRVFQVHNGVLDIITREQEQLSISVKLQSVRWLIHFISLL